MSFEQLEGHLAEFEGKTIGVRVPIRGTTHVGYYGELQINHDWANHSIYYSVRFYPDADINFQAHDVHEIIHSPTSELKATVVLKSEDERFKPQHV